ncbi:MAG: hypothetical protein ACYC6C_12975 [Coriobacteriia bacterium]
MLKTVVEDSLALASELYEQALSQARSCDGNQAMSRMLAALCVLKGRQPREYEPIYQRFRNVVAEALRASAVSGDSSAERLAEFLEDRSSFNLAQRWLEEMSDCGEPALAESSLREELMRRDAVKDPALRKLLDLMVRVAGTCGTAYLDGLRARGEEAVLVIAQSYRSPIDPYGPIHDLQWDVFPSATCHLRPEHRGDEPEEARVAVVPRLWVDALRDFPPSQRGYVVLAESLESYQRTSQTCAAVAEAIARSCRKDLFSLEQTVSHEQWRRSMGAQARYQRLAREGAASVLSLRRTWG